MRLSVWLIMAFSLLCIIMTSTEIYLFMKRRLSTRAYLISMWVKASLIVFCWGLISIFNWSGVPRTFPLGLYSDENFLLQQYVPCKAFHAYRPGARSWLITAALQFLLRCTMRSRNILHMEASLVVWRLHLR
jgi:hypothetical protein